MKNYALIISASILLVACNRNELERSQHQKDSLMNVLTDRNADLKDHEASINELISSFNEVERNLDSVAIRQQIIYLNADKARGDLKATQKERINAQISAINSLMNSNRKTIADLKRKLKGSSKLNNKLKETITTLSDQLAQKDVELAALNERLLSLNAQVAQLQTSVDTLTAQNDNRARIISDNTMTMHTAYYVVGRSKELRDAKLIDHKGGLLGLGRTPILSADVDNSKFTRIDYTQVSSIPVNSSHIRIVTSHPLDSYKLEKDPHNKNLVTNLVVINPERFWATSKYLVIEGTPVQTDKTLSTSQEKVQPNKY